MLRSSLSRKALSSNLRTFATSSTRSLFLNSRFTIPSAQVPFVQAQTRWLSSTPRFFEPAAAVQLQHEDHQDSLPTGQASITKFSQLSERGLVADSVVRTITEQMGFEDMTLVQSSTINSCLDGADVIAQAKTGTGKTLGFLVPVLQRIINQDPMLAERGGRVSRDIRAIIISPTRELAEQIAVEARKVTRDTSVIVQTAVGGSSKRADLAKLNRQGCHILVATPGRLKDVLSTGEVEAQGLEMMVLDEADRLLDDGFGPEIREIQRHLPPPQQSQRQTLMFSATMPQSVMGMARSFLQPDFRFVKTVQEGEAATHERVEQKLVQLQGLENTMPALLELLKREIANTESELPFKAIVFFNATAEASLAAATFQQLARNPQHPVRGTTFVELHGKLSQGQRTKNSERFRHAKNGIMFCSDVAARGMDFPNVTHVIQAGLPKDRESYVHRLGRTARGGKAGEGWLLVIPQEKREIGKMLQGMPLQREDSLESSAVDMTKEAELPTSVAENLTECIQASMGVDMKKKFDAYRATLGVFTWLSDKQAIVDMMNTRAKFGWGMPTPPSISAMLVQKLRLRSVRGLNIGKDSPAVGGDFNRGSTRSSSQFGDRRRKFEQRGGGGRRGGFEPRGGFGREDNSQRRGRFSDNRDDGFSRDRPARATQY